MTDERTEYHLKMAKASPKEVNRLRDFLQELEERIEMFGTPAGVGEWVIENFPKTPWRRTVEGYAVMFENACDPDPALSSLEWKPETHAWLAMAAYEGQPGCSCLIRS